jgi:micrococcal nuclease
MLLTLLALLALGALAGAPGSVAAPEARGVVASVYDGDTLTLTTGSRIRLVQIDTPELGGGECYSRAARTKLLQLVPLGSRVVLESDPNLDQVDRYGRLLRYVRKGKMNVNVALVRAGAAAPWFYDGDRGRYANRLLAEAIRAKAAKRGLWKACPQTVLDPFHGVETGTSAPQGGTGSGGGCDPSYAGVCIPSPPPDLDCDDIRAMGLAPVRVVGSDPHRLDGDDDGWGCE